VVDPGRVGRELGSQGGSAVLDRPREVGAERGPGQSQYGSGEAGLHDAALVGEVEQQPRVGQVVDRLTVDRGDGDPVRAGRDLAQRVQHLGRRAGAGHRHHPVVAAARHVFGSADRVGLAETGAFPQLGDALGDEPRGAAAENEHPLARGGEFPPRRVREIEGLGPDVGLTGNLGGSHIHVCGLCSFLLA
jgi:hypothetical protein